MNDLLMELLKAVIIAVVPILATYGIKALNSYKLNNDIISDNILIKKAYDDIIDIIIQVVKSTSQTYVDSLKNQNGFTKEAQIEAFNITKQKILDLLSEEMKEFIVNKYGDLDLWLETKIEQVVKDNK